MFNTDWYNRAVEFIETDIKEGNDLSSYNQVIKDCIEREDYEGAKAIKDALENAHKPVKNAYMNV